MKQFKTLTGQDLPKVINLIEIVSKAEGKPVKLKV